VDLYHDKGKRNTAERHRVPRSYACFQVTAINGKPDPNTFILNIIPLVAKIESPPLAIPAMSLELKFLVPGEKLETRLIDFIDIPIKQNKFDFCIPYICGLQQTKGRIKRIMI
jgi:hypothetical protein